MISSQALSSWAILACLIVSPALAYMLPGDFIFHRVEDQWKDSPGIALQRQVVRADAQTPRPAPTRTDPAVRAAADTSASPAYASEQVYLRGGHLRVDAPGLTWWYPDTSRQTPDVADADGQAHRPGIIDAIFLQPPGQMKEVLESLDISTDWVSLDRLPTPEAALPFRLVFRIGADGRASMPQIQVEKDRWYIRRLQFRETPRGPLWLAEYDGQGGTPDLPPWLPTRIQVYRNGERFETITVVRRLSTPLRDNLFNPRATPRKP